jgi:3D (Asp-Asp-Asp) domain-containing protein
MEVRRARFNALHLTAMILAVPFTVFTLVTDGIAAVKTKTQQHRKVTSKSKKRTKNTQLRSSIVAELPVLFTEPCCGEKGKPQANEADKTLDLHRSLLAEIPSLFNKDLTAPAPVNKEEDERNTQDLLHTFVATAYSINNLTACGVKVRTGIIAADPSVLPLGSIVRIEAGKYSGIYRVLDTGPGVRGKRLDIYMPCRKEAITFGRRKVQIEVVRYGWSEKASELQQLQAAPAGE